MDRGVKKECIKKKNKFWEKKFEYIEQHVGKTKN